MKKLLTLLTLLLAAWTASQAQSANDPVINDDGTETYRLACVADTWVRNANGHTKTNHGNEANIELQGMYGFLAFEKLNIPSNKKIKSANLRTITTVANGNRAITIYPYVDFNEMEATYESEVGKINNTLELQTIVNTQLNGNQNWIDINPPASLDERINNSDITSIVNYLYVGSDNNLNFMIRNENANKLCIATKDYDKDITLTDNTVITKEQLAPYLEITLEDDNDLNGVVIILPDADTTIREDKNDNQGNADSMELGKGTFMGLMRFYIPTEFLNSESYDITDVTLRLVTTISKGDRKVYLYDYPNEFAENTTYSKEESFVSESKNNPYIATFTANGIGNMSMGDDKENNNWGNYTSVESWTNKIPLTEYVTEKLSNGLTSFNILLDRPVTNDNLKIATKEATDITNDGTKSNGGTPFTFEAKDLVPQLTITYVKKPTIKISKNDKDLDASITVNGTHKVDNRITITVDNEGFDYSQVKVDVAPRTEAKNMAPRKAAEAGTSEYHTATADENGINVTFLKAGKYTMTIAPADEAELQFKAISQDVDIETLKVTVGKPMTSEWTQDFAYGGGGYTLKSLIEYPGSAEIEDLDVTLTLTPNTDGFNTATQPTEWSLSTGMNEEMWNLMLAMQEGGKVDAYYSTPTDQQKAVDLVWGVDGSKVSGNVTAWFPCSGVYTLTPSSSDEGVEFVGSEGAPIESVDYTIQPNAKLSYTYTDDMEEQQKETLSLSGYIVGEDGTMVIDKKLTKEELSEMVLYLPGCYLVEVDYTLDFTQSTEQDGTENLSRSEVKRKVSGKNGLTLDLSDLKNTNTTGASLSLTLSKNGATADPYTFSISLGENPNVSTGIEGIEAEAEADGEAEYFTLQGVKVKNPDHGIYIRVAGGKASKVIL